jgi:hypothetical protein
MLQIGGLRLFAQLSSLLVVLALRDISLETLGLYAMSISVMSLISVFLTYEGTFLVISRNIKPSRFFANLKVSRIVWFVSLLSFFIFQELRSEIIVCIMGFLIALDSEYLVNTVTMGKRTFGNNESFKKLLRIKIVTTELLIPALSASAIYLGYFFGLGVFYCVVLVAINICLLVVAFRKSRRAQWREILPDPKGVTMATLKRGDSQFYRLVIGGIFGAATLGQIYPALVVGRVGSILGNIWYSWYFKEVESVKSVSSLIWKYKIVLFWAVIILAYAYSLVAQPLFTLAVDWKVELLVYAVFFIINVQFFFKTFLRSIAVNGRQTYSYNAVLALTLVFRFLAALLLSGSFESWLIICVLLDFIVFLSFQRMLIFRSNQVKFPNRNILRVTNLPTEDYPASGLTSHKLAEGETDLLAIPFPAELCLHNYDSQKLVLDFAIDLRDRKRSRIGRLLASIYFSFKVAKYAIMNNISIIHIHWVPLIFTGLFVGNSTKLFLTIHGEDARFLKRGLFRQLARKVDKLYVVGSYWTKVLLDAKLNVEEVPNFSPIQRPNSEKISRKLSFGGDELSGSTFNLCLVGAEKEHKNLRIFKDLPDEFFDLLESGKAKLDFVGITSNYIEQLGVSRASLINCHGRCSREVTLDIINRSDVLLIPSYTEGNPKVVWEAVELGVTPVISRSLTFSGYNHQIYPYTFEPENADGFWSVIRLAMAGHSNITLSNYFTISRRDDVRKIYEEAYSNKVLE